MLFVAVTLGFFVENQREHLIEHKREKQYIKSMIADLRTDTTNLSAGNRWFNQIIKASDTLLKNYSVFTKGYSQMTYRNYSYILSGYPDFVYTDRTMQQLKNAGGFRLLRNKKVATEIIAYDQFYYNAMTNMEAQHNSFYETVVKLRNKVFVQEIISKIFNQYQYKTVPLSANYWIDSMINKNKIPLQAEVQSALLFEFKNALLSYKQDYIDNVKGGYDDLLKYQQGLLTLISKEYHLE